jgi:hypothetical protein
LVANHRNQCELSKKEFIGRKGKFTESMRVWRTKLKNWTKMKGLQGLERKLLLLL